MTTVTTILTNNASNLDRFSKIFQKTYKNGDLSFCIYLITAAVLDKTIKSILLAGPSLPVIKSANPCRPPLASELSSPQEHFSKQNPNSPDNNTYAYRLSLPITEINYFVGLLLVCLINRKDIDSIQEISSNLLFSATDVSSISTVVDLAIEYQMMDVLARANEMLSAIEPTHPSVESANAVLRRQHLVDRASINLNEINSLSGRDFEELVKKHLGRFSGFASIANTPATGDYGADLIITTKNETRIAVQCKRFNTKVNLKAVQEIVGAIKHYGCDIGIVISNNGFLPSAIELAKSNQIELWGGEFLLKLIVGDFDFSEIFSNDL